LIAPGSDCAARVTTDAAAMPPIRRVPIDGRPVFLTIVTADRMPLMREDAMKVLVLDAMRSAHRRHRFRHWASVILDDHLHLLIQPTPASKVDVIVAAIKRWVTCGRRRVGQGKGRIWQRRFHDHVIRDDRDLHRHMDYIHYNPVKHGYCRSAVDYRWSSFHAWRQRGVYPAQWGCIEPINTVGMHPE
jgi:putative transposase